MKIGLRGGHSANCIGAVGLKNEYLCMQELYKHTEAVLKKYGHTVINCNSNGSNANAELSEGARKANEGKVDYFISLHMNSFNGKAYGTEAYVYSENSRAKGIAERLVNNFSTLGFYNRGVKYNAKYYEMKNIDAPNIIFETCFCDSQKDVNIFKNKSYESMAYAIANAIDSNIPKEGVKVGLNPTHYINSKTNIPVYKEMELKTKFGELVPNEQVEYIYSNGTSAYIRFGSQGVLTGCIEQKYLYNIGSEQAKSTYMVQVGPFSNKENAESMVKELKEKGINGIIKEE